jgi:hypothetical protein
LKNALNRSHIKDSVSYPVGAKFNVFEFGRYRVLTFKRAFSMGFIRSALMTKEFSVDICAVKLNRRPCKTSTTRMNADDLG